MVMLEFAKSLVARGFDVDVYASSVGPLWSTHFATLPRVRRIESADSVKPFTYDFAYFQHQVAGLFDYDKCENERESTLIVFGRLGRRTILESGGWYHDNALGDLTIANSELTAERLAETGVRHRIHTFYNAAPAEFFFTRDSYKEAPENILVITNHRDESLLGAVEILRKSLTVKPVGNHGGILRKSFMVKHVGIHGSGNALVTPRHIREADLVVTIGKSAQYALASRTPLYIYDQFGGPGYLDGKNYPSAFRHSFTGRCCERRLTSSEIVDEITRGYREHVRYIGALDEASLEMFKLENHINKLLSLPARSNEDKRDSLKANGSGVILEKMLAEHLATSNE